MCGDIRTQMLSIGGPDPLTNPLLNFGPPACGLANCHNSFEVDMSVGFDDVYFHPGNSVFFNSTRWEIQKNIVDTENEGIWDEYGVGYLRDWQFAECVSHNPDCTRGFGIVFDFGDNFFSTAMPPSGEDGLPVPAEYKYIASFFGVTFNPYTNQYTMDFGGEKLTPINDSDPNWYRRSIPLTSVELVSKGLITFLSGQPTIHLPGRNLGQVNTYFIDPSWQPPDLSTITSDSWACWMFKFITDILPCNSGNLLNSLISSIFSWIDNGIVNVYTPFCLLA